jgi:hypothetical protein
MLAELYSSPRCIEARQEERSRFLTQWKGTMTAIHGNAPGHGTHVYATISARLQAAYIYNPKAAHTSILTMLAAASGGDMRSIRIEHLGNSPNSSKAAADAIPAHYKIFTFVREPASAFFSGYAEAAHRMLTWGRTRRARGADATFGKEDCHAPEANSTRFRAFMDDVLAQRRLGYDTYHIWPQVVKLDALPDSRRFDFIGKMEDLDADWSKLLQLLGKAKVPTKAVNPAAHQVDQCGQAITVPSETRRAAMPTLCQLLRADYACLGYELPGSCQRQASAASPSDGCSPTRTKLLSAQCAQGSLLSVGVRAFSDSTYPYNAIPPPLVGARFFRLPHRIRPPTELRLEVGDSAAPFSVWVWWNNRTGLGRPSLPAGFVPAGEGPRYFRQGAVPTVRSPHPGASEMWVYHQERRAPPPTSLTLTLGVRKELTGGIAITSSCDVRLEPSECVPTQK